MPLTLNPSLEPIFSMKMIYVFLPSFILYTPSLEGSFFIKLDFFIKLALREGFEPTTQPFRADRSAAELTEH